MCALQGAPRPRAGPNTGVRSLATLEYNDTPPMADESMATTTALLRLGPLPAMGRVREAGRGGGQAGARRSWLIGE